jgi:hypothetical protein
MASLRASPPPTIGEQAVRKVVDYQDEAVFGPFVSETDKLPRNVLQFFTDSLILTIRPSGTEPKLKLYCHLLPDEDSAPRRGLALLDELRARADAAARQVYNDLLARIDLSLGEAGLLLPDIIELERKRRFEQDTAPQLREALVKNTFPTLDALLNWLRKAVAEMTPGTDPLPALKAPIGYLCDKWAGGGAVSPLLAELDNWAKR